MGAVESLTIVAASFMLLVMIANAVLAGLLQMVSVAIDQEGV